MSLTITEVYNGLSHMDRHNFLLEALKEYNFGYEGSDLNMCEVCYDKDFERGGLGSRIDINCSECGKTYCDKCAKIHASHNEQYDDYKCLTHQK